MASAAPQPFGPFLLLERLGEGSTGMVDLARPLDPSLGFPELLVVKRLHVHLSSKKSFVRRFRHEGLLAISVDDPRIATVYDVGRVGEMFYLAMEYVPGWKLQQLLNYLAAKNTWPSVRAVVSLAVSALRGANALHEAKHPRSGAALQAVHRDLSPNNLIVDPQGRLRVIDVGLGKSDAQDWRTKTGAIVGSLGYISPEQIKAEPVDRRSDLYSLAVVLHELLTLRPFIPRGDRAAMLQASVKPRFVAPSEVRPNVPDGLDACVQAALSIDPTERPESCEVFAQQLLSLVAGADTPSREIGAYVAADPEVQNRENYTPLNEVEIPEAEFEVTEIFARRAPPPVPPHSLVPVEEDLMTPTRVDPSSDADATRIAEVINSEEEQRTKLRDSMTPEVDNTRMVDPATDVRVIPVTSTGHSNRPPGARAIPRWLPWVALAILVPITAAVSIMVDRAVRPPKTVVATPAAPATPPPAVRPKVQPVIQPKVSANPTLPKPPPAVEDPPATAPPPRAPRRVVRKAAPPPSRPPPPKRAFDRTREIQSITRRANALAKRSPNKANEARRLIMDVSMWSASKDDAQAEIALRDAKRKLRALESKPD